MTHANHTPGPWTIDDTGMYLQVRGNLSDRKHMAHEEVVARVFHADDAQLIAASPDMYEELRFLMESCIETKERKYTDGSSYEVEIICSDESTVKRIREIIAKINGGNK